MLFLPPALKFRFAFFCHFSAALSSLCRDFDIRAHARVLTSYYSGIPSRSARLRTRFASIMRNVYPTNRVPIPCRKRTRTGSRRARKKKKGKEKEKGHGLSSYRRRIELRFLSNSGDRTNLKSAGSRRWILTTIPAGASLSRKWLNIDTAECLICSLFVSFAWNFYRDIWNIVDWFSKILYNPFRLHNQSFSSDDFFSFTFRIRQRFFWNIKWSIEQIRYCLCNEKGFVNNSLCATQEMQIDFLSLLCFDVVFISNFELILLKALSIIYFQ